MLKYRRGNQFIYEVIKDYKLYTIEDKFCSYQTILDEQDYVLYLFNQRNKEMLNEGMQNILKQYLKLLIMQI